MSNSIERAAIARATAIQNIPSIGEEYNKFSETIYRLYDACYIDPPQKFLVGKKEVHVNTKKYFILTECESIVRTLASESPDFDTLYDFATFIKYMEKVFFYKNDADAMVCCDSQIDDDNIRVLVLKTSEDVILKINMNRIKRSIDINTYRYYGKKMIFGYTIIDRKVDFKGKSDITLMNNIVLSMEKIMSSFFLKIVIAVANNKIGLHPLVIRFEPLDWKDINIYKFIDEYYYPYELEYCFDKKTPTYKLIEKMIKKRIIYSH